MQLRPYQEAALAALRQSYASGKRAPLLCSPTGSGKSAMTKYMLGRTSKNTLYLCHRAELADMIHEDLKSAGLPHGMITANSKAEPDRYKLHVGMMQTVTRRLDRLPAFDWVISDEAHLAMSDTWLRILRHYSAALHLGMSATPCRLDGKGLGEIYDDIVYGPSVAELINLGFLSPYRAFAPSEAIGSIKRIAGDYQMNDAARVLDTSTITGKAVDEYLKRADGKRALVFCCTVEHAEHVAGQFRASDIPAASIDGAMNKAERAARIQAFRDGTTPVLTNVDLLTTGFDCPQIEVAIFLRPTQSLALYLQMVGRVMRIAPGKSEALLIDHVGNTLRHGLPDTTRHFTLDGQVKDPERKLPIRQCKECFAVFPPAPVCPVCGYEFPIQQRERKEVDGELAEITHPVAPPDRNRDYDDWLRRAPLAVVMRGRYTRQQIEEVRIARGYRPGWTFHRLGSMSRGGEAA